MSVEIAWKQNILVTDFQLLKSLLVVFGFGSQAFVCGFSRQNICSVALYHKWDVKNDFAYVLKFFSLIFDSLGSVWCKLHLGVQPRGNQAEPEASK